MGQTQFGGWLPEGYKAFNAYYAHERCPKGQQLLESGEKVPQKAS
jgi:hypothetical protein